MSILPEILTIIFKYCEYSTKVEFSQINQFMNRYSKYQISDIYTAIANLDYYSLIYTPDLNWITEIQAKTVYWSDNIHLICKYIRHTKYFDIRVVYRLINNNQLNIINEILAKHSFKSKDYCYYYHECFIAACVLGYKKSINHLLSIISVKDIHNMETNNTDVRDLCLLGTCIYKQTNHLLNTYKCALYAACINGNINNIVKVLLKNSVDVFGTPILFAACFKCNIDTVKMISEKYICNWDIGLYGACMGGNLKAVKYMIYKGATKIDIGIYTSVYHNHYNVASYLQLINTMPLNKQILQVNYKMNIKH